MTDYTLVATPTIFISSGRSASLVKTCIDAHAPGVAFGSSLTYEARYLFTDTVGVAGVDAPATIYHLALEQVFQFLWEFEGGKGYSETCTFGVGTALSQHLDYGAIVTEVIRFVETILPNGVYHDSLVSTAYCADEFANGVLGSLTSGVGLAGTLTAFNAVRILETLGIAETLSAPTTYNISLLQTVRLTSSLAWFFGGALADQFSAVSNLTLGFATYPILSDTVGVAPTLTPTLVFRLTATETIGLDDVDIINQILHDGFADGIEVAAGYISPNGTFTTWAVNTRSGATTEYQNFTFNSFTQVRNKYLAASSSGLYELSGDDDDTSSIVARLESGLMQMAETRLGAFKAAYIGARGDGQFLLKMVSGDGKETVYGFQMRDMTTTKVQLGKGLRSRYFAFELVSTGQDFDLDSIEFVPIQEKRRVS